MNRYRHSGRVETDPAFLADAMLLGLARWLRVSGFDTRDDQGDTDTRLAERAADEGRILLTRDRALARAPGRARVLRLDQDDALQQLRAVLESLQPRRLPGLFSRCLLCNRWVHPAEADAVRQQVPEAPRAQGGPFHRCRGCGRVYWPGSHTRHMRQQLQQTLPEWFPDSV